MRITNLEITNLRGIQNSNIVFPMDTRFVCLIGSGDNTKSTILLAIEWLFYRTWNLSVNDNDFFAGNTDEEITVRGTFTEIPDAFMAEDKFGMYLRKPGVPYDKVSDDEPEDEIPVCLTMQLSIDSTLEPHWNIVCNRLDPKPISHRDRNKLAVGVVGDNCAKDLSWGRSSILQKYADAKGVLHNVYTEAIRNATENVDLKELDDLVPEVSNIGNQYGVGFDGEIKNKLMIQNGSFTTNAGLFDGDIPLNLKGLGTQRLLSMGLNINAYPDNAILLVDEIEHGLEPYRLRSLINQLRSQMNSGGQVLITTHSPVVLTECSVSELMTVHSNNGVTQVIPIISDDPKLNEQFQRQIRSDTEAFLSKALIICEGKTEIGFIKALDDYIAGARGHRMAYRGIGTALGSGDTIFAYADVFRNLGYVTSIFMDSDEESKNQEKTKHRLIYGVSIFDWDTPYSIEEQLFHDLPEILVQELIDVVVDEKGGNVMKNEFIKNQISFTEYEDRIILTDFSEETRLHLGSMAKRKTKNGKIGEWYKRIDLGRKIGQLIFQKWELVNTECKLHKTVTSIIDWVETI